VYDSSAKLSSGILNGNVNRYGDYDQCLGVVAKNAEYQGKYCLAYIQPSVATDFQYLNYLRTLALSYEAYKSDFDDVSVTMKRPLSVLPLYF
jgi:Nose resistant-to-fluoxetine protein, N-terminal domain